jgi:3-hydroxy-9,10-secoandrosta-1,3,5(10)-triene-9,17-dione monooxygenase
MTALKSRPTEAAIPTEAELIERARRLVPVLRERAEATEANRSMLDANLKAFVDAGFYRICQPKAYGGYEHSPQVLFRVAIELARGCPSSAWCLCLIGVHNWEIGLLDPRLAEDLWGKDDTVRISSSYAPFGQVTEVEGGYRLSGRWPWSSGCDHCSWVVLGAVVRREGKPPGLVAFYVERPNYEIIDTWHVFGLKGTGSKDIVVKDAFIPDYRTHAFEDSFFKREPGLSTFTARTYKYPFGVTFAHCLASVTIGMAEGALEHSLAHFRERRHAMDNSAAIDDPFVRRRIAEADSIVRGLRQRMDAAFAQLDAYIDSGEPIPIDVRVACKWDAQCIGKGAMEAVELLFKASGARGIMLSNPIQRFFRDVHAASNHSYLHIDKGSVNAGGVLMGADTLDMAI